MFALPVVFDGSGVKAVVGVKFAAAVPSFEFLGVFGIFFDFDIDDDARVRMFFADGLQNLRTVPAAAQFRFYRKINDVRDVAVRDGIRKPAELRGGAVLAIFLFEKRPEFPFDFIVKQMLHRNPFVCRERRFIQRLDLRQPRRFLCDIENLEHGINRCDSLL